jgi:hypothetical protein
MRATEGTVVVAAVAAYSGNNNGLGTLNILLLNFYVKGVDR